MSQDVEMRDSEEVVETNEVNEANEANGNDKDTNTNDDTNTDKNDKDSTDKNEKTPNIKLPLARTKRIVNQDDDVSLVSVAAYAAINAATQDFVRYLSEQAGLMARMDQRKTVAYKDVAEAISKNPKLEFLGDIIPKTIPARTLIQRGISVPKEPTGNVSLTNFFKPSGGSNAGTGTSTPVRTTATSTPAPEEEAEAIEID
ncbi:Nuclear transcription factor Y subunit C-2 [Yarrowia sp. B02]|nr:Nuclear transcription factor Y subunit C-2 [Yarrowia sp. B02]